MINLKECIDIEQSIFSIGYMNPIDCYLGLRKSDLKSRKKDQHGLLLDM